MLSDDDIQNVLERAMENQFSKSRPAPLNFFAHRLPDGLMLPLTVSIHKWAIADITDQDTLLTIKGMARIVVREVTEVQLALTREMVFGVAGLLPHQPRWTDESPLFAAHDGIGQDRFGVPGGNIVVSVRSAPDDIANAIDRLVELDPDGSYDSDERLRIFCPKPLERTLMRACAKVGANCRVFSIRGFDGNPPWVMSRDTHPCSMLMTTPSFDLPVEGNKLTAGAKYVVWINDPRLAVQVTS